MGPRIALPPLFLVVSSLAILSCSRSASRQATRWDDPVPHLRAAAAALGGSEALRRTGTLDLLLAGDRVMSFQSRRADPPWDREPSSVRLVHDAASARWLWQTSNSYPGLGAFAVRRVFGPEGGFEIDPLRNSHGPEVLEVSAAEAEVSRRSLVRFFPGLLIEQAMDSAANATSLDPVRAGGRLWQRVVFRDPFGRAIVLQLDHETLELGGYSFRRRDEVRGVAAESVAVGGYRAAGAMRLPSTRREFINGELERDLAITVRAGHPREDSLFAVPPGYLPLSPAGATAHGLIMEHGAPTELTRIGRGVLVDARSGAMVVEFRDHTVVFDCPNDFATSQATIDAVQAALPTKAVRIMVASHTHPDHCGGARAYFAAGVTVIAASDHLGFYQRLARVAHVIAPDAYDAQARPPHIEPLAPGGSRVLEDATMRVDLLNVGPSPHSQEMLIAFVPSEGLVWQVDLFLGRMTGGSGPARPVSDWFARELERRQWRVRRILDTHTGVLYTRAQLDSALIQAGFQPLRPE